MFSEPSAKAKMLRERLAAFMGEHIYPNEQPYQEQVETGDSSPLTDIYARADAEGITTEAAAEDIALSRLV